MLKPVEPASSVTTVWHKDPAVEAFPDEYLDTVLTDPGCWREQLTLRNGSAPTTFVIGVVPPGELIRAEDDARFGSEAFRPHSLFWHCFLHGVRDINGGFGDAPKVTVNGVEYVDPGWLESQFGGALRMCALFLGRVIWTWNNTQGADVKN